MEVRYNLNAKLTLNAGLMTLAKEHSFLCVDAQCLPVATLTVAGDTFKKEAYYNIHVVITEKKNIIVLQEPEISPQECLTVSQVGVQ